MTAIPPPLRAWSRDTQNHCAYEEIPHHWKTHDVLTFLADTGMYDACLYHVLDDAEKKRVLQFKSEYFKKRFMVSRSVLKQVLRNIPGTGNAAGIVLTREKNGRISVRDRHDIFISLSYSGSCIALTIGKRKIGCDIEMVLPRELQKIRSVPLFDGGTGRDGKDLHQHLFQVWTLLEAYAKFHDMSLAPLTKDRFFLSDAHFVSYLIDQRSILSLASDTRPMKDALLWIDPGCGLASCCTGKKAPCLQPSPDGDTYVRA